MTTNWKVSCSTISSKTCYCWSI